jgi:hypothetical protein
MPSFALLLFIQVKNNICNIKCCSKHEDSPKTTGKRTNSVSVLWRRIRKKEEEDKEKDP